MMTSTPEQIIQETATFKTAHVCDVLLPLTVVAVYLHQLHSHQPPLQLPQRQ